MYEYSNDSQDFYIGKTHSSYFAVALYGEDGIIKATCRNFRALLEEMNENNSIMIEEEIVLFEDEIFFKDLGDKLRNERLQKQINLSAKQQASLEQNKRIREELDKRNDVQQADILAIVGMASALSQFSKESLGGGMKSFETENGYKIYTEPISIGESPYSLLFIPTREGKHAFLESFIESALRTSLIKMRKHTIRRFIDSFVGEVDRIFEREFSNLTEISRRLEDEKKIRHGGKPALLYAPSGVRYGYNLSREGATFQAEMETIAKMCKGIKSSENAIEIRYGKRRLLFEDLGDCFLVTEQ